MASEPKTTLLLTINFNFNTQATKKVKFKLRVYGKGDSMP